MTDRLIDLAAAAVQHAQAAARNVQQTEAAAQAVSAGSQKCARSTELAPSSCCICALCVKPSVTTPQLLATCMWHVALPKLGADVVVLLVVFVACLAVGPGLHCGECAGRYPVHEGAALHRAAGTHSSPRFAAATAATGVWPRIVQCCVHTQPNLGFAGHGSLALAVGSRQCSAAHSSCGVYGRACLHCLQVSLVVLDSATFHFRQDFTDAAQRSRLMLSMAQQLAQLAEQRGVAVVMVNQVCARTGGVCLASLSPAAVVNAGCV